MSGERESFFPPPSEGEGQGGGDAEPAAGKGNGKLRHHPSFDGLEKPILFRRPEKRHTSLVHEEYEEHNVNASH